MGTGACPLHNEVHHPPAPSVKVKDAGRYIPLLAPYAFVACPGAILPFALLYLFKI
jgi:hypothetical protein